MTFSANSHVCGSEDTRSREIGVFHAVYFMLNKGLTMRIGVDLGGTKIEAVAIADDGSERWRQRVDTPTTDYHAIVQAIVGLVTRLETELGQRGSVGIGTPGSVSRVSGLMKNCNSTVLNGRPLRADMERWLGREVRLANDADCFALSEATDGAAAGAESVFGVILGTGAGGGLVLRQQALAGPNGICGEWGHNPMPLPRDARHALRTCYCGRNDCVESWLSGTGFAYSYHQLTGERCSARVVAQRLAAGEDAAKQCYDRYVDYLARALAVVINIFDPFVVVLGGGMSNIDSLYRDVLKCWGAYVFSDRVDTRLVKARYGDSSGVRGAAWLWPGASADGASPKQ